MCVRRPTCELIYEFKTTKNTKNDKWHFLGIGEDELQRQNRITAQIVANYLERKLFPYKRPTQRLPTVDEILPTMRQPPTDTETESKPKHTRHLQNSNANVDLDDALNVNVRLNDDYDDEQDPENLQSVESKHFDSIYQDIIDNNIDQGRSIKYLIFLLFFSFFYSFCPSILHPTLTLTHMHAHKRITH